MSATAATPQHTPETVVEAFSRGDCWALALALADRFQHLTPCVVGQENGGLGWIHMLVRDDRDPSGETYVDVLGQHTLNEVIDYWDAFPDWEEIIPLGRADTTRETSDLPRYYPDVPVEAGIAHIVTAGWQPPPHH